MPTAQAETTDLDLTWVRAQFPSLAPDRATASLRFFSTAPAALRFRSA